MTNKIYLRIIGDYFSPNVFREITALTNYAKVNIKNVIFEENKNILSIPIERYHIETFRRFLGPKYNQKKKIPSLIKIGAVRKYNIENHFNEEDITQVQLLFGLSVRINEKEIYLGSVDECLGQSCYSITAMVGQFDIEISDL
jgi:hypothetical protein